MRKFTLEELNRFKGENGAPVYIAFKNRVYDVSGSWHWKSGNHWSLHDAGCDLTDEIMAAPHGEEMIEKFPVIGELAN